MGALPSRESTEDPSTVFFANCGSHVVFHIPMTPHFFPDADSLAFQQLFHSRNHQSALYCFDMRDVSAVLPKTSAEAFRDAQEEDWGTETDEIDPSLHYYDAEVQEKILECGGPPAAVKAAAKTVNRPIVGQHHRHSIEDPVELHHVLVEKPCAATLVETDEVMCRHFEAERRWRGALTDYFQKPQEEENDSDNHKGTKRGTSSFVRNKKLLDREPAQQLPPPPEMFLSPLPHAIALRMTTEEEEEMRAAYCKLHSILYVAPHFHDVKPGSTPPSMDSSAVRGGGRTGTSTSGEPAQEQQQPSASTSVSGGVPRISNSTCFVACPQPLPLPLVERRRYHFEDDPKYRDGRVHLVEEHGVLYHFAYFPKTQTHTASDALGKGNGEQGGGGLSGLRHDMSPDGKLLVSTPIVLDRCLHDVVYCEEPDTPTASSTNAATRHATSSFFASQVGGGNGGAGGPGAFTGEPELAPERRYGRCARCGARIEQRMDYTRLRRLKSTRVARRAAAQAASATATAGNRYELDCRAGGAEDGMVGEQNESVGSAAAQQRAWAAFATDHEVARARNGGAKGEDELGADNDADDIASHTEQVEEEGESEFIINIAPVRIVGMDGLLPSTSRGTSWLRGYESVQEAAEDAFVEQLAVKPPVMRTCRFVEGSVGDKIVNRAALVSMISYRPMCRQAGLRNALTRPVWSLCVLSNIPYLQMVRETFFRAKAAVAEIDDADLLMRDWLDVVDRENNFYNFINANLYMMRNFTPTERTVRPHDLTEDSGSNATGTGNASHGPQDPMHPHGGAGGGFANSNVGTVAGSCSVASPLFGNEQEKTGEAAMSDGTGREKVKTSSTSVFAISPMTSSTHQARASANGCATGVTVSERDPVTQDELHHHGHHSSSSSVGDGDVASRNLAVTTSPALAQQACIVVPPFTTTATTAAKRKPAGTSSPISSIAVEGDGASYTHSTDGGTSTTELRGHRLTRDLEEATIGRPEGHGPRDHMDDDSSEDDDDAQSPQGRSKSDKETSSTKKGKTASTRPARAAAATAACEESKKTTKEAAWRSPVTARIEPAMARGVSPRHPRRGRLCTADDGGEASGQPAPAQSITTAAATGPHQQQHARLVCSRSSSGSSRSHSTRNVAMAEEKNDDDDFRLEEEEKAKPQDGATSETTHRARQTPTALTVVTASGDGNADDSIVFGSEDAQLSRSLTTTTASPTRVQPSRSHQSRVEVPPRPNFQLFSSRLEPHAPLALYTLFDNDGTGESAAAARGETETTTAKDDAAAHSSVPLGTSTGGLPSYVQHDVLLENERRQAEPKATRRPSHALYECGMLATTRGRHFLFLLREDCVHALLYYLSFAAAPIFIGAYIEPVDTTSVSYGGAVRLQSGERTGHTPPSSLADEVTSVCTFPPAPGSRNSPALTDQREEVMGTPGEAEDWVVIGPVEGMEVMAEYYKSKGLITCFSVSDVQKVAPGPSAAHRLRKMILPACPSGSSSQSPEDSPHARATPLAVSNGSQGASDGNGTRQHNSATGSRLAARQAHEAQHYGHVFTYSAEEFRDGDLVVYNLDERRWEHYEHVQLRRRFAARAAGIASQPRHRDGGGDSTSSHGILVSSLASTRVSSINVDGQLPGVSVADTSSAAEVAAGGLRSGLHDDVVVAVDGSFGGLSSTPDPSMSARLLCVGLDELLLSWTKWVVDNRFYEDRSDLGWLNLPDGSPLQLGGRYFLWSFRHNHQRYFYGVIPKFAKGRLRRQKLLERNRKKRKNDGDGAAVVSPVAADSAATTMSGGKASVKAEATLRVSSSSEKQAPSRGANSGRTQQQQQSTLASRLLPSSQLPQQRPHSREVSPSTGAYVDPHHSSYAPSPRSNGSPTYDNTDFSQPQQQQQQRRARSSGRQRTQEAEAAERAADMRAAAWAAAAAGLSASTAPGGVAQSSAVSGHNNASGVAFPFSPTALHDTVRVGTAAGGASIRNASPAGTANNTSMSGRMVRTSSANNALHPAAAAAEGNDGRRWSMRQAPLTLPAAEANTMPSGPICIPHGFTNMQLQTPSSASGRGVGNVNAASTATPLLMSPGTHYVQLHRGAGTAAGGAGGGGGNYYYQYGGNTFIQDGKQHENEYYPPLPPKAAFHPAPPALVTAAKLIPLPHPQTEQGGIPAIFRYWGPAGLPSSARAAAHAHSAASSAPSGMSAARQAPMFFHHHHEQRLQQLTTQQVGLPSNTVVSVAGQPIVTTTSTTTTMDVLGGSMNQLTIHVRRRGMASSTTSVSAVGGGLIPGGAPTTVSGGPGGPALLATTGSGGHYRHSGPSSLSGSVTTLAIGPSSSFAGHAPRTSSFPSSPVVHGAASELAVGASSTTAATAVIGGASSLPTRKLSPTSMLPANLINEGSKTKGESLLRVEEDTYRQREAFRWNPYASTKWVQGSREEEAPPE